MGGASAARPPATQSRQLQESSQSGKRGSCPADQSREGRRLTGSALAPGIWSRRHGVSGGGGAGKPRCWRGQGLRRPAVRGQARGLGRRPAGRAQPAGRGRRRAREGSSVSGGDPEGSRLAAQAPTVTGLGPSPRPGTPDHPSAAGRGRDRSPLPEPRGVPQRSALSAAELRGVPEGLRPPA